MYAQLRQGRPRLAEPLVDLTPRWRAAVSRNVVKLGLTSLFTDISSEMVSTVLPLYLVFFLRFTPFQFGMLDGLYQGGAAVLRLVGGVAADRSQRYKEVAGLGYGLSAVSKIGLFFGPVGGPAVLAGSLFVDRTGKAIRTAPRDALISLSSDANSLGMSFAVHRALDTCGAMVGPLLAFAVLAVIPDGYDVIFVGSFCAALVGLAILTLFVDNRPIKASPAPVAPRVPYTRIADLLRRAPRFKYLVMAATCLSVATISDGFLYLVLQHQLAFAASFIPLLYVATSLVYFVLALPAGRLADRFGRGRVFLVGYALLLTVYAVLLLPTQLGTGVLIGCIVLFGAYYALTDGILMALASSLLPSEVRTSGLAMLSAAIGLGSLAASVIFGALWTVAGPLSTVCVFVGCLVVAIGLTLYTLWRTRVQTIQSAT